MIVKQTESQPASFPTVAGLSFEAQSLDQSALWQRIEDWIAYRYSQREVVWTVEGPCYFDPPLVPATVTTSELWDGEAFQPVELISAPVGFALESGTYRITATVGTTDNPPEAVQEAFRRLAEYLADDAKIARSVNRQSVQLGNGIAFEAERSPAWMAKALQSSGAADLLRRYRKP